MENYVEIKNLIDSFNNGASISLVQAIKYLEQTLHDYEQKSMVLQDYQVELEDTKQDVNNIKSGLDEIYNMICGRLNSGRYETLDIEISDICLRYKE